MCFFQFSPLKLGVKVSILTDFFFDWVEFHHHHHHHHHHQEKINRIGGGFNLFYIFTPETLGKWFNLICAYFSDGRAKNHQLDFVCLGLNVWVNIYLHYIYHKKSTIHVGINIPFIHGSLMGIVHSKFDDLSQGFPLGIWWGSSSSPPMSSGWPSQVITDDEYTWGLGRPRGVGGWEDMCFLWCKVVGSPKNQTLRIQSPKLRMVMEPEYLPEDMIIHPNHHLTRWLDP